MTKSTLREVTSYDAALVQAIRKLLAQLTTAPTTFDEEALRTLIENPASHLYILQEGAAVVGMLTLGIYHSSTGCKGWIEDVVVDEKVRGCGYGKELVEKAIAEARRYGVQQLMLTSNPRRVAANKLYQQMGFEPKETNCYRMEL